MQLHVSNATAERQTFDVVYDSLGNSLNLQMREHISSHSIRAIEDDHSSDEEQIQHAKAFLSEDLRAAVNFNVKKDPLMLTHNFSLTKFWRYFFTTFYINNKGWTIFLLINSQQTIFSVFGVLFLHVWHSKFRLDKLFSNLERQIETKFVSIPLDSSPERHARQIFLD